MAGAFCLAFPRFSDVQVRLREGNSLNMSVKRLVSLSVAGVLCGAGSGAALACATCGCTLSADAATGYSSATGWRMNLQYDYIDQNRLRRGTHSATPEQVVNSPADPGADASEIEKQTINHYFTLGISYSPSANWSFNLLVPYVDRYHTTYGEQQAPYSSNETAADQISSAKFSKLGDIKLITNFQGLLPTHNFGLQLGIKLPTGKYGTHTQFRDGPAAGEALDASLQAGTGSTDLILGAYFYKAVSQNFDAFINGQYQTPVAHAQNDAGNDFKPGKYVTISTGLRYEAHVNWIPQVQVNFSHRSADRGALADEPDTAGTAVYLSPGITVRVLDRLHAYGFVQIPVYSKLDGYQLFPHWTATIGAAYAF